MNEIVAKTLPRFMQFAHKRSAAVSVYVSDFEDEMNFRAIVDFCGITLCVIRDRGQFIFSIELKGKWLEVEVVWKYLDRGVVFTETLDDAALLSFFEAHIDWIRDAADDAHVVNDLWHFQKKERAARFKPC